ncbi:cytidylate kinase [Salinisphaera orenii MK-B5]|uniref:Cytidylate kinase n=2 Tax=Salinisphaera TaxID=180541 RepID=A0A423PRT3_9GAMM|nr:(d)CMP kinase [Salinisphaera orenii]ROO28304.1 cytidylate kinase [Salinisphaera orenii MK-B5]
MNSSPVMTLDGPGGAGKGTLASALARELGWYLLDSGALYRLVGLTALRRGLDPAAETDRERGAEAARHLELYFEPDSGDGQRVHLAGEDVTEAIRSDLVSEAASQWAVQAAVRDALLQRQRAFAVPPGLIADGRDMGTVIFPEADLKLFVTASAAERAARRYAQLSELHADANLDRIYQEIVERDARDASRAVAPLKPAVDAHVIDTTGETVAASIERVRGLVREKGWL